MTREQLAVIVGTLLLFGVLYLGCETKSKDHKTLVQSRSVNAKSTSISNLKQEASKSLETLAAQEISILEQELVKAIEDSSKIAAHKRLSGKWYEFGFPSISGFHAKEVALIQNDEEAWSVAGTTFLICIQNATREKDRDFCSLEAVEAFNNAISMNPENVAHRINLALVHVENPPQENPMKGILMLRDLNSSNPENVQVLNQLARLAIRTGQFERAIERLNTALTYDGTNKVTNCLLANAYEQTGEQEKAVFFGKKCQEN